MLFSEHEWGFNPLTSLSGTTVSAGHAFGLLAASLAIYAWPMAAIAAFGLFLSTVTRNSAAAVVGTLMWALFMQFLGVLPGLESIRPYLLAEQFQAWHGFLRTPADWTPVVRALWVCALYVTFRSRPATCLRPPRRRRRVGHSRPRPRGQVHVVAKDARNCHELSTAGPSRVVSPAVGRRDMAPAAIDGHTTPVRSRP